ncbi:MAG TPA: CpsD/CapB family tyrosine-protein kinase, partial [Polyangia bacterium]|nr:CpsD/CapB family tyrosine-protein kinase [Polyangia bacterium]
TRRTQGDRSADDSSSTETAAPGEAVNPEQRTTSLVPLRPQQKGIIAVEARSRELETSPLKGMATRQQLDSFRELRTRLVATAAAAGLSHFTTLVVPVSSGAGASFVARNLAVAFALEERRLAILVDCNLRHPTQHAALGMRGPEVGLFDFLERPEGDVDRLIRPTPVPGLHLIPAGRPPSIPREYFSSQAMQMVMGALRQPSCYVFLDSPPAKGAPDARILSDLADFVILVVGYAMEAPETIAKTAAMFDPAKFVGVVFNERS